MKVLLANHTPLCGSGSGTYTRMIGNGLAAAGHEVVILTPPPEVDLEVNHVSSHAVLLPMNALPSFTGHPLSPLTYEQLDRTSIREVASAWENAFVAVAKEFRPDVVHIQHAWLVARAAARTGLRPIVTSHGSEFECATRCPALALDCIPAQQEVGMMLYVSHYVERQAMQLRLEFRPATVLHNPYANDMFRPLAMRIHRRDLTTVGFVGRLVKYKHCSDLIAFASRLRQLLPGLRVLIVGDGPERESLERTVHDLQLDDCVQFLGYVPFQDMPSIYNSLDVLVVPSDNEPFGLTALEAVGCGTPVVAARAGGLTDLIHPPFVIGYERGNLRKLMVAVNSALAARSNSTFASDAAEYASSRFSVEGHIQQLLRLYANFRNTALS